MNKAVYRIAGLILAFVMILGNAFNATAAGNAYYVSAGGNDANPGTASAPFGTFAKANTVLTPGSTLYIYAGIYRQPLKITTSGTSAAPITVQPYGGKVVLDLRFTTGPGVEVRASHVAVNQLVVRNIRGVCVNLKGSRITVNRLIVHHCSGHGIHANNSSRVRILNSTVYRAVLSNSSRTRTSGWGSGIKVRLSKGVLIQGNTVYNNYGEGMATRGTNIIVRDNKVFDNYSVNIYTNSENARIERNFVFCTTNSGFERSGMPATGIGMGEEYFPGWGARLKNLKVINNIVSFCKHGIRYSGADQGVSGGGLKNAIIAYNTLYGSTNSALSIAYESGQSASLIANNILWQAKNRLAVIDNPAGLTFQNNLWKVLPPAALRGPGDQVGDPEFSGMPDYTPEGYRLLSSSPAIGAAVDTGILNDYYNNQRGPEFDMGAIQISTAVIPSTQVPRTATLVEATSTLPPVTIQDTETPVPSTAQPASLVPTGTEQPLAPGS